MRGPRNALFRHQKPRRFLFALQETLSFEGVSRGTRGRVMCQSNSRSSLDERSGGREKGVGWKWCDQGLICTSNRFLKN